jgi:uncharacterized membrane protein YfcA
MATGQWLRRKMCPALFRRCFCIALMALGGHLLLRAAGQPCRFGNFNT